MSGFVNDTCGRTCVEQLNLEGGNIPNFDGGVEVGPIIGKELGAKDDDAVGWVSMGFFNFVFWSYHDYEGIGSKLFAIIVGHVFELYSCGDRAQT